MPAHRAQTLLLDADDTLWENNIYFERAIANFISFLNHREFSPIQVREVLNAVELESIREHGYGLHSFAQGSHVIFYQPQPYGVLIVRILHGSQDVRRHLGTGDTP